MCMLFTTSELGRVVSAQVHNCVRELEGNLEDLSLNQQYANDGIYLLCRCCSPASCACILHAAHSWLNTSFSGLVHSELPAACRVQCCRKCACRALGRECCVSARGAWRRMQRSRLHLPLN